MTWSDLSTFAWRVRNLVTAVKYSSQVTMDISDPSGGVSLDNASRAKRQKLSSPIDEDKPNPYLAYMNMDGANYNGYGNGHAGGSSRSTSSLTKFQRHSTTAALARKAEDGPFNPFNSKPLSDKYISILKVRRNLPVHAQRLVLLLRL